MKRTIGIVVLVILLIGGVLLVYGPYNPDRPPAADDSDATPEGMQVIADASNRFAFDMYAYLNDAQGNVFYSPYSIFSALAMTYEGAQGSTQEEMAQVLYLPDKETLRPNFAGIYNSLNDAQGYVLRSGNALWTDEDHPFLPAFIDIVERYYGGKAADLDYGDPVRAAGIINAFIEAQTQERIKNLIDPGAITPDTALVLTNAIYFKGTWETRFNVKDTQEQPFHVSPEEFVLVDMMTMDPNDVLFDYVEQEDIQAIRLPYRGERISMIIIVPQEMGVFEGSFTHDQYASIISRMTERKLSSIALPRFEFDTTYTDVADHLIDLGMPSAFYAADFSGMDGGAGGLTISEVIHKAFIQVDEEGSEAAAATAVIMMRTSIGMDPSFRADRPFIFLIEDAESGLILFMGKVMDPHA